ncbi:MAG TPA: PepSY-associated TM helix domain-containing protein [Ferruginibacter sp.]|nr:PepSY-associated TM helix domain-containing protein [Ferruginibacter sp.]
MKKNFIFYIHSVAGLVSGLFILLMSLSGAALVFHDELDQRPEIQNRPLQNFSLDSCYRLVQKQYPHAQVSNCSLPGNDTQPVSFIIYDSSYKNGTKALEVFLHPQTGEVVRTRGGSDDMQHNFMSWLSKFHNSFHLEKKGEWLLGFFALVFLISIITGLILFRKSIIAVLLFKKIAYRKGNLHQLIGIYALLFNLMIAVTGFWMQRYVFKKDFYASYNYKPVLKPSPVLSFSFDSAYKELQAKHPDFSASVIYFAQSKKGKTAVYGSRSSNSFIHSKKFADAIMLDSNGAIASTRFVTEISSDDRYDIINSQLHMGKYGGVGVKIIYFFFGLAGGLLSITGFLLWLKRRRDC